MATENTVELLISLVKNRPVIWDKTLDTYKNSNLRTSAWREICVLLKDDFEEMEERERQDYSKSIIKKWTNIRDCWMRSIKEHRKFKKSGSTAARPKQYVHHHQLSFLKKIATSAVNHDSASNDNSLTLDNTGEKTTLPIPDSPMDQDATVEHSQQELFEKKKKIMKKRQNSNELEMKMSDFKDLQIKCETETEDRNLFFFKSLLPSLATLNDEQILGFHTGVLNLLQSIKYKEP